MSYLGFLTAVRDRLLAAPHVPAGVSEGAWDSLRKQLRNDDKWDPTAYDATQAQKPAPYFIVSDNVRSQVEYWKNRRNDCAHAKSNAIEGSHVEMMWLFIQSNLPKFVVNGSRAALLDKLGRHFDPRI